MCLQGAVLVNDAARIVDRHMSFREGIAYGIDQLLEPPGLGAHCDMLENRTTYVCNAYIEGLMGSEVEANCMTFFALLTRVTTPLEQL